MHNYIPIVHYDAFLSNHGCRQLPSVKKKKNNFCVNPKKHLQQFNNPSGDTAVRYNVMYSNFIRQISAPW